GDGGKEMQRAAAVRLDLAFEHRSHAEVVQDRADPVDVLRRKRRLRREQLVQLSANARRRTFEREHDRQRLLAFHEVVHLDLPGALGGGPDAEKIVVRLERLPELLAEARELLAYRG